MQSIEQLALEFTQELGRLYFVNRDFAAVARVLHPQITWLGTGTQEVCRGLDDARRLLAREKEADYNRFIISDHWQQAAALSEDQCMVWGEMKIKEDVSHPIVMDLSLRFSVVCCVEHGEMKLFHVHFSAPSQEQKPEEFFPRQLSQSNNQMLRKMMGEQSRELNRRNRDLELLSSNIPGVVKCCLNDGGFTILQLSNGFQSMFGYSTREIGTVFQNQAALLIHPKDRLEACGSIREQLGRGSAFEVEYRIARRAETELWVLDKGQLVHSGDGQDYLYSVMVDISNVKRVQEELRLSLERHQIIMDQADDIIFEWDIIKNTVEISPNWQKKFGYAPENTRGHEELAITANVHPEDKALMHQLRNSIYSGNSYAQTEVRIRKADSSYIWCKLRTSVQCNQNGQPFQCVGVIVDIDSEKRRSQRLLAQAQRDALTSLYNKTTIYERISACLEQNEEKRQHALLILDIDNFKYINDTQGHLFGDAVLLDVARSLQRTFRSTDLIGRIGGDEFLVFLSDIPDTEFVARKADEMRVALKNLFQEEPDYHISSSIGIALFPKDARSYQELYQKADQALYHVKKQGKNGFLFYERNYVQEKLVSKTETDCTSVNETIDSEGSGRVLSDKLVEYVFRILYQSTDMEQAIDLILEIVGRHYNVSRVYIFENSEDDRYCDNTFEWCSEGVSPQKDQLQHYPYQDEEGFDYRENFNENGVFYCRDISRLRPGLAELLGQQGIASVLQCAIRDAGELGGFVGFDECRKNRFWTQEQVEALAFIAQILSTFLLKKRAQNHLSQALQLVNTILEHQRNWTYVIEKKTYRLLFITQKTAGAVPQAVPGVTCYKAFFHREAPCEHCPIAVLEREGSPRPILIENKLLRMQAKAEACTVPWTDGEEAYLVSLYDMKKLDSVEPQAGG